jgi:hypothetical protein
MLPRYADDLRFQIERSPFSEEITVCMFRPFTKDCKDIEFVFAYSNNAVLDYRIVPVGAGTGVVVRGIFDESVERDEGSKALRRKLRVRVYGWPKSAGHATAVRIRDTEYAVTSYEADANLGIVVWLR